MLLLLLWVNFKQTKANHIFQDYKVQNGDQTALDPMPEKSDVLVDEEL